MLPQAEAIGTNTFHLLPLVSASGRTADLNFFFSLLKLDRKTLFLIYMLLLVVAIRKKLRIIKQKKSLIFNAY